MSLNFERLEKWKVFRFQPIFAFSLELSTNINFIARLWKETFLKGGFQRQKQIQCIKMGHKIQYWENPHKESCLKFSVSNILVNGTFSVDNTKSQQGLWAPKFTKKMLQDQVVGSTS